MIKRIPYAKKTLTKRIPLELFFRNSRLDDPEAMQPLKTIIRWPYKKDATPSDQHKGRQDVNHWLTIIYYTYCGASASLRDNGTFCTLPLFFAGHFIISVVYTVVMNKPLWLFHTTNGCATLFFSHRCQAVETAILQSK